MRRSVSLLRSASLNGLRSDRLESTLPLPLRRTVVIEGNIASGKTECLEYLSRNPNIQTIAEPVDKWRNVRGHNTLDLMYKDPARWSLTLQTYVQLTMMQAHATQQTRPVKVMERSIFSAKYCFVENLRTAGLMPPVEYAVLSEWFDWLITNWHLEVDLIVYLRTKPEIVCERLRKRHRSEEMAVTLDYLSKLHNLHEDWLTDGRFPVPCHVVTVDANADLESVQKQCEREITNRFFPENAAEARQAIAHS
uniref:Deoxynucleoside kinase domain-containing protein n=1 Tax=Plectus sambesii TaxID=2011161 RepID=A0A914XDP9_9BILA